MLSTLRAHVSLKTLVELVSLLPVSFCKTVVEVQLVFTTFRRQTLACAVYTRRRACVITVNLTH